MGVDMRHLPIACGFLLASAASALGASTNVTFSGTLGLSCTLTLSTPGRLALAADGTTLGSDQTGGLAASLSVVSVGTNTITVDPPTLTSSPAGYDSTGQQLSVAYSGLGAVSQAYTSSQTSFQTTLTSILAVNNQVHNTNGFVPGDYSTTTVVTCS